jgi:hypothetical protein
MSRQIGPTGSLDLRSDPRDVEGLLTSLESILSESCLDEMSAFIEVSYRLRSNDVQITVSDRGPVFQAPANLSETDLMSESGRGLQIINAWVSTLKFERRDGWNVCVLEQRIQD